MVFRLEIASIATGRADVPQHTFRWISATLQVEIGRGQNYDGSNRSHETFRLEFAHVLLRFCSTSTFGLCRCDRARLFAMGWLRHSLRPVGRQAVPRHGARIRHRRWERSPRLGCKKSNGAASVRRTWAVRITAIAVYEKEPSTFWIATASGGLLKTINNGMTFQHQFDREATVSIGDVQVCQSDPNLLWVGTGESNPRNSVSWGDGVYKSTDGGATWKNMGLRGGFQTGAIAIHPSDPNIVLVGVLGRL